MFSSKTLKTRCERLGGYAHKAQRPRRDKALGEEVRTAQRHYPNT
ncbi:MAG: hypothetical protein N2Z69_05685 [Methylophilaceae bacterium]|nr:hypothetical protein [Methylophilaceae bacterium]